MAQDTGLEAEAALKNTLEEMGRERVWTISAPTLVDFVEGSNSLGEDEEFRNLGGVLEIYSAQERLPVGLDKKIYGDVEFLVIKLQQLSRDMSIEFEFELEGVFVGAIENGRLDKISMWACWASGVGIWLFPTDVLQLILSVGVVIEFQINYAYYECLLDQIGFWLVADRVDSIRAIVSSSSGMRSSVAPNRP